jgi:hypothetical protein
MALSLQDLGNTQLISLVFMTILTINGVLSLYIENYKKSLLAVSVDRKRQFEEESLLLEQQSIPPKKSFGEEILEKISEN